MFGSKECEFVLILNHLKNVCVADVSVTNHEYALKNARKFVWLYENKHLLEAYRTALNTDEFKGMSKLDHIVEIRKRYNCSLTDAVALYDFFKESM